MNILDEILAHKRKELVAARERTSDEEMARAASAASIPARGFRAALMEGPKPRIIAEIKRRSPSKGEIRADFDPVEIARAYTAAGAAALSVLTDEHYFGGSLDIFRAVREVTSLPLLRKDFVIDAYQIDEARAAGADAVLLIVSALDRSALEGLRVHARELGMDVLVEVHDEAELDVAASIGADLIGVNNRNLRRFVTDLATTERLAPKVPRDAVLVSESGIFGSEDVKRLAAAGAQALLVGESLMRETDVGAALKRLRGAQ
ncbi:MAG: indole-3-glycerol phosphate synthase TrpC [Deltaproteobacteria bacterium]|nr:indole-3-glycerol phosphate synthase TrpC [Deltaproteobacteria bacterium]MBW2394234.1 indole-3-glycerol phosphate synthase TrpC [Deltaproteobacteria bacterium]